MTDLSFTPHLLFFFIVLLFLSAFFSASETAFFSLPMVKIKAFQNSSNLQKKKVAKLVLHPKNLLVTVFLLNTLVNLLIQNTASSMFGEKGSFLLKVGFPLVSTLIFGEIFPKCLGLALNEPLALRVSSLFYLAQKLLRPLNQLIIKITAPLSHFLFFFLKKSAPLQREEIEHLLKSSQDQGLIENEQAEFIQGYLELQEIKIKDVMCPKEDILGYNIEEPLSRLIHLFADEECSRVPIYKGSLEDVLGIFSAKEFFLHQKKIGSGEDVPKFLKKPLFVPENAKARGLLKKFSHAKEKMALVVNEYGSLSGIVTTEDIMEVVIGDVSDPHNLEKLYTETSSHEVIANGKWEIADFNEFFHSDLKSEHHMITIGGFLIEKIGAIPKPGTIFEYENFYFHILSSDLKRIKKVFIRNNTQGVKK